MPAASPELRLATAKAGAAARWADPEAAAEARRDLAAERLAVAVQRIVDQAPPLTDEQRARIGALLRPTGTAAA